MNPREVAALLAYVVRLDPRMNVEDQAAAEERLAQWCDLLSDVPAQAHGWDAAQTARDYIARNPYRIQPSDISRPWHAHKAAALARHTDPTPAVDPDNVAAWRAELIGTRQAVATGAALPSTHRELTSGGPAPEVRDRLAAIGRRIPPEAAAALAQYRPRRAERERLAAEDRPDPYAVPCRYCRARIDKPCRNHRGVPRTAPHPSRLDDATARHHAQQEQSA
ncbi:cell surface glycoprotein [Streptomyces sp. 891-h]|uniref:zinc finger domain-containing protein n=1 Tax=Streptomyces sp. 891-h TaxID=2720714 RepID=UPI001FAA8DFB|nr:cell surface glycoprotein [Streptomyces sp. 891-h]UNZ18893.1 cell surface glycoprotein [Streptomyces sp. 891-h]